jgi:hypothetical protein
MYKAIKIFLSKSIDINDNFELQSKRHLKETSNYLDNIKNLLNMIYKNVTQFLQRLYMFHSNIPVTLFIHSLCDVTAK